VKRFFYSAVVMATLAASAAGAAEVAGKVTDIRNWDSGIVHFHIAQPPSGCAYFHFDGSTPGGKGMLSLLTSARLARSTVHLGYSGGPVCVVQFVQINEN
jgi:hypothetical protein